jgi:G3E family GTPase
VDPSAQESGLGNGHGESHGNEHSGLPDRAGIDSRLPVTMLVGDAVLLNHILYQQKETKFAVIEGIMSDDASQELQSQSSEMETIDHGCIRCRVRGDTTKSLHSVAALCKDGLKLDGLVIQLKTVEESEKVMRIIGSEAEVKQFFYIEHLVAIVDAQRAIGKDNEAQIAFSRTVLLVNVDLVPAEELTEITAHINELKSAVEIVMYGQAQVDISRLFHVR